MIHAAEYFSLASRCSGGHTLDGTHAVISENAPCSSEPSNASRFEHPRQWTTDDRTRLGRLHEEGVPNSEIAARLGRTVEAVSNMARRLGLRRRPPARPWAAEQLRLLETMIEGGCSLLQIANATSHPRPSVADKLRQAGFRSRLHRRHWSDGECGLVRELHAAGASLTDIVRAMPSRSSDAIEQKLRELAGAAPFRSIKSRSRQVPSEQGTELAPPVPLQPAASSERPLTVAAVPCRTAEPVAKHRNGSPTAVAASVDDIVRWLRSRDYIVLQQSDGWRVDRQHLGSEADLVEFANIRRARLSQPPFADISLGNKPITASMPSAAAPFRFINRQHPQKHWPVQDGIR